ncbi:uncharacterized protein PHACADRAFT_210521 [Phanerochaete carnosa HHB-10118-sp]|uniref:Uncharacterized protein n=1 Tax=Phanerochaete carnosa (strain HHB-10118-sp) TaxID=650164 RepID=K5W702_PHACS|nr:uncharacterized protein PHACADRAFT_210521 [Phanerochaete carnosa HHB-10118-sp]EKM54739.1 hypothetical protein PHACADRAFT_210521 [Phanerochaete carnosa HHB-10118-sp]
MHISLPFRSAPSAEFVYPHLDSLQHVWKRVYEHVMGRGDTYKREAFNGMHDESRIIDPEIYADLRVSHDTLSFERDSLMETLDDPTNISAELVSEAYAYKCKAKLLHKDVLKALEAAERKPTPMSSPPNTLRLFKFPDESATSVTDSSLYGYDIDLVKPRL